MIDFKKIFGRKQEENIPISDGEDVVNDISNWYSNRYETIILQRNFLLLLVFISMLFIILSTYIVGNVASNHTVTPFVVDIDKTSGITNIVNPLSRKDLLTNDALNKYFVIKYIQNRETYSEVDYQYKYMTVIRVLSSADIYSKFKRFINTDLKSPIKIYNKSIVTSFQLRSVQFVDKDKAVVRFTISVGDVQQYKIATVQYVYQQMELNLEERMINPLGFQVIGYRVDDEIL